MTGALLVLLFMALATALVFTSVSTQRRGERRRALAQSDTTGANRQERSRYTRQAALLSEPERAYFGVLEPIARELDLVVSCKTRLADLVLVATDANNRIALTNRISNQVVDFVLCDRTTMAPLVAIEIDDAWRRTAAQRRGDDIREECLAAAELPLLRVRGQRQYAASELRRAIDAALSNCEPAPSQLAEAA